MRYVPEYERRWERFARPPGTSWRMDETAVPVRGGRHYLSGSGQEGEVRRVYALQRSRQRFSAGIFPFSSGPAASPVA
jgi:transposase-like protein